MRRGLLGIRLPIENGTRKWDCPPLPHAVILSVERKFDRNLDGSKTVRFCYLFLSHRSDTDLRREEKGELLSQVRGRMMLKKSFSYTEIGVHKGGRDGHSHRIAVLGRQLNLHDAELCHCNAEARTFSSLYLSCLVLPPIASCAGEMYEKCCSVLIFFMSFPLRLFRKAERGRRVFASERTSEFSTWLKQNPAKGSFTSLPLLDASPGSLEQLFAGQESSRWEVEEKFSWEETLHFADVSTKRRSRGTPGCTVLLAPAGVGLSSS